MEELERLAIVHALEQSSGNRTHAAGKLGISVRTLQRKLRQYEGESQTETYSQRRFDADLTFCRNRDKTREPAGVLGPPNRGSSAVQKSAFSRLPASISGYRYSHCI